MTVDSGWAAIPTSTWPGRRQRGRRALRQLRRQRQPDGSFVVNGSPTQTQVADSAGGRSQLTQLTTSAAVLLVLLLLTGPLASLPIAALA